MILCVHMIEKALPFLHIKEVIVMDVKEVVILPENMKHDDS